jgi:hypothetical protein
VRYDALSIKQPWATLLAHGRKTIEVRRWRTYFRGTLLIHAAHLSDERPEAWARVPADLHEEARRVGGIVGVGQLDDCKVYRTLPDFVADEAQHLNDPGWFEPQGLFGLCFTELRVLPYHRVPGYVRIFKVDLDIDLPEVPSVVEVEEGDPRAAARQRFLDLLEKHRPHRKPDSSKE